MQKSAYRLFGIRKPSKSPGNSRMQVEGASWMSWWPDRGVWGAWLLPDWRMNTVPPAVIHRFEVDLWVGRRI